MVSTVFESILRICYKTVNTLKLFGPIIPLLENNIKETIKNKGKNMHFRIFFKYWITNMIK